jgi:hypothetical protein
MLFGIAIFTRAARGAAVNNGCDPLPEKFWLLCPIGAAEVYKYWRLIFVGTLYETCCVSPFRRLEL